MTEKTTPVGEALAAWSVDKMGKPYLIGRKCQGCEKFHFPPVDNCSECLSDRLKSVQFGRKGRLYTYSIIEVSSLGFEAPYAIGYIDLDQGIRLYSMITEWKAEELKNGRSMELVITKIRKDAEGNDVKGYAYRPIDK